MGDDPSFNDLVNGQTASRPLNILIAGAGIGGLTAALGLRKNGHNVTVFEQSRTGTDIGAAVTLAPNANGILRRLGIEAQNDGAILRQKHTEYNAAGQPLISIDLTKTAGLFQHPDIFCRRVAIHNSLKSAAISPDGGGPPVNIHTSSRVVDVDVQSCTVFLENGSQVSGDCIIGADGVKSITRTKVHDKKPFPSGKSAYRFLVERSKALSSSHAADVVKGKGEFLMWSGRDRRIWMYTTHFNELLNVVCVHPDALSEVQESNEAFGDSESKVDNKAKMMEIFKEFDPRALALLELAEPSSVRLWKLLDMDPPTTRLAGRLCLLGDAALPFLPNLGLGAACAIEDAACLAAILPPGTTCADVPERFQLYEECRMAYAGKVHHISRRFGEDLDAQDKDARMKRDLLLVEFYPQVLSHDEHDRTTQKLREFLYRKHPPRWSMPIAFGPMPGPRQTFRGRKADGSSFVRWGVRFKTSRTLLMNLLPRHFISFVGPGSVAYASFSHTTFSNVSWLGGKSYDELCFHIHGVQCTKADGSTVPGSFLAVVFVNAADAIANDREQLGIPKVFCNLEAKREDSSGHTIKASWHGTEFVEIRLQNHVNGFTLAEPSSMNNSSSNKIEADSSIFTHRYIPAFANKGNPLADCIVCLSTTSNPSNEEEKTAEAGFSDATIKWNTHSEKKLPTLHHIVQRLAELPIIEIVKATVTEGMKGIRTYEDAFVVEGF